MLHWVRLSEPVRRVHSHLLTAMPIYLSVQGLSDCRRFVGLLASVQLVLVQD